MSQDDTPAKPVTTLQLIDTLEKVGRPRLVVVGDLILDEYVWGGVERISPEAPIPVLRVTRRERRPGGAGSVVANLAVLGAEVSVLGAVGDDAAGEQLIEHFEGLGARTDLIGKLEGHTTTLKTRHLGFVQHADRAVQQLLRVDSEKTGPLPEDFIEGLLDRLSERLDEFDAILVSDYDKGLLTDRICQRIIERVAGRIPVLADPAPLASYERYRGSFLICPNRYETARASGISCADLEGCRRAGTELARSLDLAHVAVTMDRDGIYLCDRDDRCQHFSTEARVVSDVTGAGDMVLSLLGLAVGGGASVEVAIRLANVAAGLEIRCLGSTPIPREELVNELVYQGHTGASKLKTREELVEVVAGHRARGETIVLTNGCFDLLHFGHHHLLQRAKTHGDVLVVAVNSDRSVRQIKGGNRPINKERERMLMLSGLECVDYVVVFEEETPIPLLEALRPEVLVKGEEYRDGRVVGQDLVEGYGGRIELVEQIPGISTTALVEGSYFEPPSS